MIPDQLNSVSSSYIVVRELYSRMVFSLRIGVSISMEIIALWLWLQGSGLPDFLLNIDSFDDYHVLVIASSAQEFVEALHVELTDADGKSVPRSDFQMGAIEGVSFYLDKVCYKVLQDIRERTQMRELLLHEIQHQAHVQPHPLIHRPPMSAKQLLSKIKAMHGKKEQGEGTASSSRNPLQVHASRRMVVEDEQEEIYGYHQPARHLATLLDNLRIREMHNNAAMVQQLGEVPHDERTLFVTFSNGYPLTKDELHEFFMRHYGDIEEITIEEPVEARPPLYAHVTFFSQMTLFRVLDGNKRVKFVTRGKHLWARQFVPKKKKLRVEEL